MLVIKLLIIGFIGFIIESILINYFIKINTKYTLLVPLVIYLVYFHNAYFIYNKNITWFNKIIYLILFTTLVAYVGLNIQIQDSKISDIQRILIVNLHAIGIPYILNKMI